MIAAFLKKDCNYRNNCGIQLRDVNQCSLMKKKKKKLDVHMMFFPFLCFGIPDLASEILKMLIRVCFRDVLQPSIC